MILSSVLNFLRGKKSCGCNSKPKAVSGPSKKALLVGINKYRPELDANLRGCVNDIENIRHLLITYFGFNPDNIRVIIDERATQASILDRLHWLIDEAVSGDELVFHFSGHGSQVRDRHNDELSDGLDEILCPHDLDWDNPITDDLLADIVAKVPSGAHFTMIADCCHSGTISRAIGADAAYSVKPRFILPPFDIRCRSLGRDLEKKPIGREIKCDDTLQHVLLSACRDDQTAGDANINGKFQGVLTWALTEAITENPQRTWRELHDVVTAKVNGRPQNPQLEGAPILIERLIFGGIVK